MPQAAMQSEDRLMRRVEVEQMIGLSCSAIYEQMDNGKFPRPIRVGKRAVRWRRSAIEGWIAAQEVVG